IGSPAMNFMDGTVQLDGERTVFAEKNSKLLLPVAKDAEAKLAPYIGRDIWLGVRPEHIGDYEQFRGPASFTGMVEVVEPMGNEIFVYFTTGSGTQYVARIISNEEPRAGMPLKFAFDMAKAHFFDKASEAVI
ncbi:MAG: TOBE domain-containing protein, partial [Ignavibacteriales bacterium]|nr:TOBE domain-containing protein [Ignavibacteriales bacterium]